MIVPELLHICEDLEHLAERGVQGVEGVMLGRLPGGHGRLDYHLLDETNRLTLVLK